MPSKIRTKDETSSFIQLQCGVTNNDWGKIGWQSLVARLIAGPDDDPMGVTIDPKQPYGELWMGSHSSVPSRSWKSGLLLSQIIGDAEYSDACASYDGSPKDMPFLFKVLSIEKALCIQAHPEKVLARKLHLLDPICFPDDNHKPEMVVALTQFEALCGFRPLEEVAFFVRHFLPLHQLMSPETVMEVISAAESLDVTTRAESVLRRAWKEVLSASSAQIRLCTQDLFTLLGSIQYTDIPTIETESHGEASTGYGNMLKRISEQHPDDAGVFAIFFMNYVQLKPGQAMYIPAGQLHAYLSGVECMASSANVLRGGLTSKRKDVELLASIQSYSHQSPCILDGQSNPYVEEAVGDAFSLLYKSPAEEFDIVRTDIQRRNARVKFAPITGPSILICTQGQGVIRDSKSEKNLVFGGIFYVKAGTGISIENQGDTSLTVYQALCNLED